MAQQAVPLIRRENYNAVRRLLNGDFPRDRFRKRPTSEVSGIIRFVLKSTRRSSPASAKPWGMFLSEGSLQDLLTRNSRGSCNSTISGRPSFRLKWICSGGDRTRDLGQTAVRERGLSFEVFPYARRTPPRRRLLPSMRFPLRL